MLSENRLEKRTIGVSSQTTKDYQDTSSNDTFYNTIAIGLSIALGHKLYKSGALKEIAKPMLEIADKLAKEGTDKASVTMSTIKEWANMKHNFNLLIKDGILHKILYLEKEIQVLHMIYLKI